jgi:hypothetical protein
MVHAAAGQRCMLQLCCQRIHRRRWSGLGDLGVKVVRVNGSGERFTFRFFGGETGVAAFEFILSGVGYEIEYFGDDFVSCSSSDLAAHCFETIFCQWTASLLCQSRYYVAAAIERIIALNIVVYKD